MKKILLLALLITSSTGVLACRVSPFYAIASNPDKFFENADVVFYGEVVGLSTKGKYTQVAQFDVKKIFKGGEYNKVIIENKIHTTCSQPFSEDGGKYIVFAKRGLTGKPLHMNDRATFMPVMLDKEMELRLEETNYAGLNFPAFEMTDDKGWFTVKFGTDSPIEVTEPTPQKIEQPEKVKLKVELDLLKPQNTGVIACPMPSFPKGATGNPIEGWVNIELLIGIDGRPTKLQILESSGGDELEKAAKKIIKWHVFPDEIGNLITRKYTWKVEE